MTFHNWDNTEPQIPLYVATNLSSVAGSSTTDIGPCRALLVGTAGNATLMPVGSTSWFVDVPLQQGVNPISVSRIASTGLTAANIWALY